MDSPPPEPKSSGLTLRPRKVARPGEGPPPRRQWWLFGLMTVVVLTSAIWMALPQEMGRWYFAAALEDWQAGEKTAAYEKLAKALEWNPTDLNPVVRRANWAKEDGRYAEALADLELCEKKVGEQPSLQATKAELFLLLGRSAEAIVIIKQQNQASLVRGVPDRSTALNQMAYYQAVAKVDLPDALAAAERSIELHAETWNRLLESAKGKALKGEALEKINEAKDMELSQVLDTRGFVHYQMGNFEFALADLNRSIELQKLSPQELEKIKDPEPASGKKSSKGAVANTRAQQNKRNLAVIYYHRSLIQTALQKSAEAAADLKLSRELLGSEPDEKLF